MHDSYRTMYDSYKTMHDSYAGTVIIVMCEGLGTVWYSAAISLYNGASHYSLLQFCIKIL